MKLINVSLIALACLGFSIAAQANTIHLTAEQPMNVTYRLAYQNANDQATFSTNRTIGLNKNNTIPLSLGNFARVGIVIVSVNGHELPSSANQFNQPQQCSMTTDKIKSTGTLEFTVSAHAISCKTKGGIFG